VQWWCFAQPGTAWTWEWRPLIGVWVSLALLVWAYRALLGRTDESGESAGLRKCRRISFGAAVFLLWASLDWPLGPLGATYLASVHMVQFLAVGVAAPPLLLLAIPPKAYEKLLPHERLMKVLDQITHPVVAFVIFNILMTLSHWPGVVDTLMPTQLGSFVIDAVWMAGGLIFWWPLIAPVPARPGFHPLAKIACLALNAFLIRPPFAMMIFSENPIFAIYELAPPPATDALDDQQLAGAVMKIGVAWIMFAGVLVIFRKWMVDESDRPSAP
jgi:cytochrome c oxidase assembly factor CtaG